MLVETRSANPMMDLGFLRMRVFSGGLISMGLWSFGVFGIYFYTAIYLQNVLGFSPTGAGAAFVPMALVHGRHRHLAPRLEARFGAGRTVALGLLIMAVALGVIASFGEGTTYSDLLPWFLVYGLGGGMLVPLNNVIVGVLPAERAGIASGMLNVSREVFGLLGVTILGAILSNRANAVAGAALHRFLDGYQFALVVAGVLIAVGVPVACRVRSRNQRKCPQWTISGGWKRSTTPGSHRHRAVAAVAAAGRRSIRPVNRRSGRTGESGLARAGVRRCRHTDARSRAVRAVADPDLPPRPCRTHRE